MRERIELSYPDKMNVAAVLAGEDGSLPASLEQTARYGGEPRGLIVRAENMKFLRAALSGNLPAFGDIRGKVKLIYVDPPFSTSDEFSDGTGARAYSDKLTGAAYVEFIRRRLILAWQLLSPDGSVFVHLDPKMSHYIKLVLDEVFGRENFRNEIAWCYTGPGSPRMRQFNRKHDTIFWYSKGERWTFNADAVRMPSEVHTGGFFGGLNGGENAAYQSRGKVPEDWWQFAVAARAAADGVNRTGYPTEKPVKLIRRIVEAASDAGDLVMDFFSGSGATAFVAEQTGRRWIVCDEGGLAYAAATRRMSNMKEARNIGEKTRYGRDAAGWIALTDGELL